MYLQIHGREIKHVIHVKIENKKVRKFKVISDRPFFNATGINIVTGWESLFRKISRNASQRLRTNITILRAEIEKNNLSYYRALK